LDRGLLARLSSTRQFDELPTLGADLLDGRLHGRIAIAL
jgi:acrylyl-CoA reductase (NADPH)